MEHGAQDRPCALQPVELGAGLVGNDAHLLAAAEDDERRVVRRLRHARAETPEPGVGGRTADAQRGAPAGRKLE